MKRVYLDYAATTPVAAEVLEAMKPYFSEKYGNAGSLHYFGQEAIAAIDRARATIAKAIDAEFDEVIFTGSATEANNLALQGVVKAASKNPKIIVSSIEHESVLETARDLEKDGIEIVYLPVDKNGVLNLEKLKSFLDERTVLVSVMYANNEIGTIEPIAEISRIIKDFNHEILIHTDAVQAFQYLDCNVNKLGIDLMTLSAHKIYGPKGVGALCIRNGIKNEIAPILQGGGQEFGFRSGTENVASIVGFTKAVELVSNSRELENKRVQGLRNHFLQELKKIYPQAERNGGEPALPNILNIYFPNHKAEDLLIKFDMAGIAVSSGSACSARSTKPSYVLQALGFSDARIKQSIRFSLGRFTTEEETRDALSRIKSIVDELRQAEIN